MPDESKKPHDPFTIIRKILSRSGDDEIVLPVSVAVPTIERIEMSSKMVVETGEPYLAINVVAVLSDEIRTLTKLRELVYQEMFEDKDLDLLGFPTEEQSSDWLDPSGDARLTKDPHP